MTISKRQMKLFKETLQKLHDDALLRANNLQRSRTSREVSRGVSSAYDFVLLALREMEAGRMYPVPSETWECDESPSGLCVGSKHDENVCVYCGDPMDERK